MLWRELKDFEFCYLLTRRLTQDCIENLFSVIRGRGGNNVTPDPQKFRLALRLAMTNQLLQPSDDGNCAIEASNFLIKKIKLETICTLPFPIEPCATNFVEMDNTEDIPASLVQENADSYVCGWLCITLPHEDCRNALSNVDEQNKLRNSHIQTKQYVNATLYYPNELAVSLFSKIKYVFNREFLNCLRQNKLHVKKQLMKIVNIQLNILCQECTNMCVSRGNNILIQCFVKKANEKKTKCITKNVKARKMFHL